MSKEAMKLALEALEKERDNYQDWDKEDGAPEYIYEAITALREALAEDVPEVGFGNTALDKKAENARELGLDYEPAPMSQPNRAIAYSAASKLRELGYEWVNDAWTHLDELAEQPAQQEPVAFIKGRGWRNGNLEVIPAKMNQTFEIDQPLYISPPAQRKPLTDEQITAIYNQVQKDWTNRYDRPVVFARAIEAKLKENT